MSSGAEPVETPRPVQGAEAREPKARSVEMPGPGEAQAQSPAKRSIDAEALLVALVLVPHSYPRNRFYSLYESRGARRARRRAALLRSIAGDLAEGASALSVRRQGEQICVRYRLEEVGVSRSCLLDEDELALLQLVVERAGHDSTTLALDDADPHARARVQERLLRLL